MEQSSRALRVDPARRHHEDVTCIYVRAQDGERFANVDIAQLDHPSLMRWLRSRGGENEWAENTVAVLLGHPCV